MAKEKRVPALLVIAMLAAALMVGVLATQAQAALTHFHGTVSSKNAKARTFQVHTQSGKSIRVRVNANTVFQRIAGGFSGLHAGLEVEVDARKTRKGLVAAHVETPKGGGSGAGGGADDPPNHH